MSMISIDQRMDGSIRAEYLAINLDGSWGDLRLTLASRVIIWEVSSIALLLITLGIYLSGLGRSSRMISAKEPSNFT